MSEKAVHPDVRVGVGSLLAFAAVVVGLFLGYPLAGTVVLLASLALLASGWTGSPIRELPAAARGDRSGE